MGSDYYCSSCVISNGVLFRSSLSASKNSSYLSSLSAYPFGMLGIIKAVLILLVAIRKISADDLSNQILRLANHETLLRGPLLKISIDIVQTIGIKSE